MEDDDPVRSIGLDDEDIVELDLPEGVHGAESAVEVLRTWVADGSLHVIFDPQTFSHDVSEWGRMLAGVAHHIATAVELDGQTSREHALATIADAFRLGMTSDEATAGTGRIKGRTAH